MKTMTPSQQVNMMAGTRGAFALSIGAAVGTLLLVPANGFAQQEVFLQEPCTSGIIYATTHGRLIACAEVGRASYQYTLGVMYANGIDVVENDAEAARWFRMAAEQGHAAAQNHLGLMYAEGEGVPEDDAEAVRWYRLAAEQGYVPAQGNLGVMYDEGGRRPRGRRGSRTLVSAGSRAAVCPCPVQPWGDVRRG